MLLLFHGIPFSQNISSIYLKVLALNNNATSEQKEVGESEDIFGAVCLRRTWTWQNLVIIDDQSSKDIRLFGYL